MKKSRLWLTPMLFSLGLMLVTGCSNKLVYSSAEQLTMNQQHPSPNRNGRIQLVVLHYTTGNWQQSLQVLTTAGPNPVSAHYLIPESIDASYPPDTPLQVYQLVAENARAWHAGVSRWENRDSLNDHSIGIELVNQSSCQRLEPKATDGRPTDAAAPELCLNADYDPAQLQLLALLLKDILQRHPDISPTRILGHSDIAPSRKQDPGSQFPWQWLARQGIGAWYEPQTLHKYWQALEQLPDLKTVQQALQLYGYDIVISGVADQQSRDVLMAFQRHFVPAQLTGEVDRRTVATLWALLDKYFAAELRRRPELQLL